MTADSMALVSQTIHYSRVIRIEGVELPYWQRVAENLWGQSVLERLWDRLLAFDRTTQVAAQLVYKAHLRTYKVEMLREIISMGGPAYEALVKQVEMIRRFQSNEGLTLMDSKDEFEAHQYAFSGLDNVLLQFGQQISGALQIPLVRLFGQSPAGLTTLLKVLHRSVLGRAHGKNFAYEFRPLWQLSDPEKADVGGKTATAVGDAYDPRS